MAAAEIASLPISTVSSIWPDPEAALGRAYTSVPRRGLKLIPISETFQKIIHPSESQRRHTRSLGRLPALSSGVSMTSIQERELKNLLQLYADFTL